MITSVIWVNVFFVPAIALWCHYKRNELKIEPSIKMLIKYAILSVLNIPLTKVGIFLAKTLLHREISIDSGYYTLMAVTAAMMLPFFIDLAKNVCENRAALFQKIKLTLKKRSMKYKEKWIAALLLTLLIVVTYGIRGPIEIYAGNAGEFLFALEDFIFPMLIVQAVVLIATSFLLALLSDVPFRFMSMILMWIGISSWIQDVFLVICRGMQYINALWGGKISRLDYLTVERPIRVDHLVEVAGEEWLVNQYHNDGIFFRDLARGLEPLAVDRENGVVEAFSVTGERILALQWHPERPFVDKRTEERTADMIRRFLAWKG